MSTSSGLKKTGTGKKCTKAEKDRSGRRPGAPGKSPPPPFPRRKAAAKGGIFLRLEKRPNHGANRGLPSSHKETGAMRSASNTVRIVLPLRRGTDDSGYIIYQAKGFETLPVRIGTGPPSRLTRTPASPHAGNRAVTLRWLHPPPAFPSRRKRRTGAMPRMERPATGGGVVPVGTENGRGRTAGFALPSPPEGTTPWNPPLPRFLPFGLPSARSL